jgi:hypothetical protein
VSSRRVSAFVNRCCGRAWEPARQCLGKRRGTLRVPRQQQKVVEEIDNAIDTSPVEEFSDERTEHEQMVDDLGRLSKSRKPALPQRHVRTTRPVRKPSSRTRTAPISPFMVDRRRPKFPVGDPLWRNGVAARFVFPVLGVVLAVAVGWVISHL